MFKNAISQIDWKSEFWKLFEKDAAVSETNTSLDVHYFEDFWVPEIFLKI